MVDVTLQDVEVSTEPVEDLVVIKVRDDRIRLNVCLTALQVTALLTELVALQVAA